MHHILELFEPDLAPSLIVKIPEDHAGILVTDNVDPQLLQASKPLLL